MNKRIKELAMQSGMVYDSPDQGQCHVSDLAIEEFNSNSKRIKEHFGIV